jgi:hypothetical protein
MLVSEYDKVGHKPGWVVTRELVATNNDLEKRVEVLESAPDPEHPVDQTGTESNTAPEA